MKESKTVRGKDTRWFGVESALYDCCQVLSFTEENVFKICLFSKDLYPNLNVLPSKMHPNIEKINFIPILLLKK
jgi:hypothetical protein